MPAGDQFKELQYTNSSPFMVQFDKINYTTDSRYFIISLTVLAISR